MFLGVFYCKNGHELRGISYIDGGFFAFLGSISANLFSKEHLWTSNIEKNIGNF